VREEDRVELIEGRELKLPETFPDLVLDVASLLD